MYARKRLDIGWSDIVSGLLDCCEPNTPERARRRLEAKWPCRKDAMALYSVRTGFDLFLRAADFNPGSQIVLSGKTIPKMIRIVEHHDLVPVPVDIDPHTLTIDIDELSGVITDDTAAIVVAHLYGSIIPLDDVVELAADVDVPVFEDAAQAFRGPEFTGHPDAEITMFSFGPIKTATALRGALAGIRDETLYRRMRSIHESYPKQSHTAYAKRFLEHALLMALGHQPTTYAGVIEACRLAGVDYEEVINHFVRSFREENFVQRLRRRPSRALCRMLERRVFDDLKRVEKRVDTAKLVLDHLDGVEVIGDEAFEHDFWLFPVLVDNPSDLVETLRSEGFDATRGSTSLTWISPPDTEQFPAPEKARQMDRRAVYLPVYPEIEDDELRRMARVVNECAS